MSPSIGRPTGVAAGLRLQGRVIHALILREMQTRFGRGGGGFLWLFIEPVLLAGMIGLMKWAMDTTGGHPGINPFLFGIVGYVPFFGFRAIVGRGGSAVPANASLMYHRQVQLIDIILARNLLEAAAVTGAVTLILGCASWVAGEDPQSISLMMLGMLLLLLYANGLGMLTAAACAVSETFDKLLQPVLYLSLPLSGALMALHWIPPAWREALLWNPQVHFHEMVRHGMFGDALPSYYDPVYMLASVVIANLLGLCALRAVRAKLEL